MTPTIRRAVLTLMGCWALSFSAFGQILSSEDDFAQNYVMKSVPLSFGGAYRAIADTNAAILLNPAGLALREGKVQVGGEYLKNGATDSQAYSASAVDGKATKWMTLGVEYDFDHLNLGNDVKVHQLTVAAATRLGPMVYVGAAVKGFLSSLDTPFNGGPDGVDADLGLLVRPIEMLSLALTARNLFLGWSFEQFPLEVGFGAAVNLKPHARFAVDLTRNFNTTSVSKINAYFGGEFSVAQGMFLRSGFGVDKVHSNNFWSVGASLAGPKIALNFTFSQRLSPVDQTYAAGIEASF